MSHHSSILAFTAKAAFRKAGGVGPRLLSRIVRQTVRERDYRTAPPVLANSVPKSGTHLLLQIVQALPRVRFFNGFIASSPSRPAIERPLHRQLAMIDRIVPREVVPGHLYFHPESAKLVAERNFVHFFIYRDPRDVCLSEAHYLSGMAGHHSMHPVFANECRNDDERLMLAIRGLDKPRPDAFYPDISVRYGYYKPWILRDDVFAVRYEDLRTANVGDIVRRMVGRYRAQSGYSFDLQQAEEAALSAINPAKSPTFRVGGTDQWKRHFGPEHRKAMKEVAGGLLIELGYERDLDW